MAHLSEPIELDLTDEQAFIVSVFIREGELRERERIIALLEAQIEHDWKENHCEACDQTDYLIALIKGEEQ